TGPGKPWPTTRSHGCPTPGAVGERSAASGQNIVPLLSPAGLQAVWTHDLPVFHPRQGVEGVPVRRAVRLAYGGASKLQQAHRTVREAELHAAKMATTE